MQSPQPASPVSRQSSPAVPERQGASSCELVKRSLPGLLIKPREKLHHPALPDEMHQFQDEADEKATDDTHQQAEDVQFLNDQCREIKAHRAIAVAVKDRARRIQRRGKESKKDG